MVENARQRAMESFRQFEKDCDFRNAHLDEWHQEHGHQWVAVFQEETQPDVEEVCKLGVMQQPAKGWIGDD